MVLVHTQKFYEKYTGEKHEIAVTFGWISPVSRGTYRVTVDDEFYSNHDSRGQAFDEVADIIKVNNWTSICPI